MSDIEALREALDVHGGDREAWQTEEVERVIEEYERLVAEAEAE